MIHAIYHLILAGVHLLAEIARIASQLPHYFGLSPADILSVLGAGK
jgi:hypothetical protein